MNTNDQHDHPLPEAIKTKIKSVFDWLSDNTLLSACLDSYTQNACESANSVIWSSLPKETFVSKSTFRAGTAMSVIAFNEERKGIASGHTAEGSLFSYTQRGTQPSLFGTGL